MSQIQFEKEAVTPSKVVCVGRNYVAHIHELQNQIPGELVLFIKPNTSISETLICPEENCRYETEITFVMKDGRFAGMGIGLDLTLVDVQNRLKSKSLPWEKAKAFDASAVFSHFVPVPESLENLSLALKINGELRQKGGVAEMIYKPEAILTETQQHFTLQDGDLLMTGTPKGVGTLVKGDTFEVALFDGDSEVLTHTWQVQ